MSEPKTVTYLVISADEIVYRTTSRPVAEGYSACYSEHCDSDVTIATVGSDEKGGAK